MSELQFDVIEYHLSGHVIEQIDKRSELILLNLANSFCTMQCWARVSLSSTCVAKHYFYSTILLSIRVQNQYGIFYLWVTCLVHQSFEVKQNNGEIFAIDD